MELSLNRLVDPITDSNCYVIRGETACMVIDPGNFDLLERMMQKWNTRPLLVLLTHGHCDHTGGLNELRKKYEVTVIATMAGSEEMQSERLNMSRMMEMFLYYKSGETVMTPYQPFVCRPADVTFHDEIEIPFEGWRFRMKALPGHTRGSCVICCEGQIFCGDYLLPGQKVITRMPGGSEEEYEKCAKPWLSSVPDGTEIFPGHGIPFIMDSEVRNFHEL